MFENFIKAVAIYNLFAAIACFAIGAVACKPAIAALGFGHVVGFFLLSGTASATTPHERKTP